MITHEDNLPVLILFNLTDHAAMPWIENGHDVVSVDPQHENDETVYYPRYKARHIKKACTAEEYLQEYKQSVVRKNFGLVIAFPVCTHLAVSGARHWKKKREANPDFQSDAVESARIATQFDGIPYVIENPVGALSTLWQPPTGYVHPWEFGGYLPTDDSHPDYPDVIPPRDAYPKKTGLWCGNGAVMPVKNPVSKPVGFSGAYTMLGGSSTRTKNIRSATPRGMAIAIYKANRHLCDVFDDPARDERRLLAWERMNDRR